MTESASKPRGLYAFAPKLDISHTDGKPAVFTISSVSVRNFAKGGQGEDWKIVLTYEELGNVEHAINRTSFRTLTDKLGPWTPGENDYNKIIPNHPWKGKKVAVTPTTRNNPETNEAVEKLDVAAPNRWDRMMDAYNRKTNAK